ncbi:MAG: hypothetical protein R3B45_03230 [Bdellovibrionota bacterium]
MLARDQLKVCPNTGQALYPELRHHMVVIANPSPLKKTMLSEMSIDFSSINTPVFTFDTNKSFVDMVQGKVNQECEWLSSYLPRDNSYKKYITMICMANAMQVDGAYIFVSNERSENIEAIQNIAGKSVHICTVLRTICLSSDPSFYWHRNHIVQTTANISTMSPKMIEEYIDSSEFERLKGESCFFTADSKWVTSVIGPEPCLFGFPIKELTKTLDELELLD